MANGLKFTLDMVDRLSAPMGKAAAATERYQKAAIAVNAAQGPLPKAVHVDTAGLDAMKKRLRDDTLAVTNLTASFKQLSQASKVDLVTMRAVSAELQTRKDSLAEVQKQLVKSGNAAKFGSEGTNRLTTTLRELSEGGGGKVQDAVQGMQEATKQLDATVSKLADTVEKMAESMGHAGEKGGSNLFGGLVRGAASAVGSKLVESFGEMVADKIKDVGGELQGVLVTAFRENPTLRGKIGAFFTGVKLLAGEKLGGIRQLWGEHQKMLTGVPEPKQLGPQVGKGSLVHLGPIQAIEKVAQPEKFQALTTAIGGTVRSGVQLVATFGSIAVAAAAVAAALALLTVGTVAVGVAFGGLVVKGASLAIEANDAKGDTIDMLEAMLGSAQAAQDTYDSIVDLTRDTTLTISKGQALAQSLTTAGLTNVSLLKDAMSSIAVVDSVIAGGGDKIQGIIEKATTAGKFDVNVKKLVGTGVQIQDLYKEISDRTGIGVKGMEKALAAGKVKAEVGIAALSAVIEKKLGTVARKQANDLPVQMERLKGSISRLFEDVDTGPFLEAVRTLVDLFDENTTSGRVMREVLTEVFDGLFAAATAVIPYVRIGLKGILNVALQVAVGLEPLLIQLGLIGDTSDDSTPGLESMIDVILLIGEAAGEAASAIAYLGTHDTIFYSLAGAVGLVLAPFLIFPALIFAAGAAFVYIVAKIDELTDALDFLFDKGMQAGKGLVDGLVNGITGAAGALIGAVKSLGQGAIDMFHKVWDMHSPSKKGLSMGKNLGLSTATGISLGEKPANDNMQRLVSIAGGRGLGPSMDSSTPAPIVSPPQQFQAAGQRSGKSVVVNLHLAAGAIVINAGAGGTEAAEELRENMAEVLAEVLEQAANKAGLAMVG